MNHMNTNNSFNSEFAEKRDFMRMKLKADMRIVCDTTQQTFTGQCIELSGKGMGIICKHDFPVNSKLTVSIISQSTKFGHLTAEVEVTRTDKTSDNKILLGCKIVKVTS